MERKNSFLENIFSVRNDERNYKIFTILGVKIKIKRKSKQKVVKLSSIIQNNGTNNKFVVVNSDGSEIKNPYIDGLRIRFFGDNNILKLYAPLPTFINCEIQMVNNATFILQSSKYTLKDFIVWKMRKGTKCEIGKNFSCEGVEIALYGEEGLEVKIGDNCMFSHDIFIQPTDNHAIIDKETLKPINFGGNITIGNHVWLCPHVHIHKGVSIADDCVIGTCSLVNKAITEEGCVSVGMPAKIVRKNITWARSSAPDYLIRGY